MEGRKEGWTVGGKAGEGRGECSMAHAISLLLDDNIPKNQSHSVFVSQF